MSDETPVPAHGPGRRRRRHWWWVAIGVFVLVYAVVLLLYHRSGQTTGIEDDGPPPTDGVTIVLSLSAVNADRSTVDAALTIVPGQDLIDPRTGALRERVQVFLDPLSGSYPLTFDPEIGIYALPVTVRLDGNLEGWPFDQYTVAMTTSASRITADGRVPIPYDVQVTGHVIHGWRITATPQVPQPEGEALAFDIVAKRAGGTLVMGLLLILVLIALPALAFFVVFETVTRRKKVEATYFSWFAALLFATVPIRGFLPGAPPPGSWVDVAVVVWVLAGLVTALGIYVWCWTRWGTDPIPAPPDQQRCQASWPVIRTGQGACRMTWSETEPRTARRNPPWPREPITMTVAPTSVASSTIARAGSPITTRPCAPSTSRPAVTRSTTA